MGKISKKMRKVAMILATAGAIWLASPFTAAADEQKPGPGVELEQGAEEETAAETGGQEDLQPEHEELQGEQLPDLKT
ncbi:MAG: hypothetical protein K2P02_06765, partial [Lachnospiraceae bacterium]|nr:hypothetical protein [Lachnospiraceae bacterium]